MRNKYLAFLLLLVPANAVLCMEIVRKINPEKTHIGIYPAKYYYRSDKNGLCVVLKNEFDIDLTHDQISGDSITFRFEQSEDHHAIKIKDHTVAQINTGDMDALIKELMLKNNESYGIAFGILNTDDTLWELAMTQGLRKEASELQQIELPVQFVRRGSLCKSTVDENIKNKILNRNYNSLACIASSKNESPSVLTDSNATENIDTDKKSTSHPAFAAHRNKVVILSLLFIGVISCYFFKASILNTIKMK